METQFRDLMVERLRQRIGQPGNYGLDSSRWWHCQLFLYMTVFGRDPNSKTGKKEVKTIDPRDVDLIKFLSDEEFVDYVELVIRRFYTQM